jgi:glucosamine-6-phosphate deaminase
MWTSTRETSTSQTARSRATRFRPSATRARSRTRLITLDTITRRDAARDFFGEDNVPREAITMGIATILGAREIAILARGEHKADIVRRAVEGEVDTEVAATFLQRHPNTTFYLDGAAAATLTRVATSLRQLRPPNPRGCQT